MPTPPTPLTPERAAFLRQRCESTDVATMLFERADVVALIEAATNRHELNGSPITPDLVELKRLHEAATPGEWSASLVQDNSGKQYPTLYQCWAFVDPSICGLWAGEGKDRKDLDFIVAAHNAFPALLAAAEERDRLAGEVAALRERVVELEAATICRSCGDSKRNCECGP